MQPDLENSHSTSAFPCDRERQALINMETPGYFGAPIRTLKLYEVVPVFLNSYTVTDAHFRFFLF